MTEQEFRDALKRQIGQTGLSSDRQYQVLAGMKGGNGKVRIRNKWKIALVLAALVMLGMTGALAGSTWGINWAGEKVEIGPLRVVTMTEQEKEVWKLIESTGEAGDVVYVWHTNADGQKSWAHTTTKDKYADSLEEMQELIAAESLLIWPEWLPEGYEMAIGRVKYDCAWPGQYTLRHAEKNDDGIEVMWMASPEEYRFASNYTLRMENAAGDVLMITVSMENKADNKILEIPEGATASKISIADMEDAMLVSSAASKELAARRFLGRTVKYSSNHRGHFYNGEFRMDETLQMYNRLVIQIKATDADMSEADLLAIFGLTAQ